MTDELKPCPFCGSQSVLLDEPISPDSYAVFCNGKCGAVGPEDEDGNKATEFWNTRPVEDALQAENARLREVVEHCCEWHAGYPHGNEEFALKTSNDLYLEAMNALKGGE